MSISQPPPRYPNLGELGIALVEHFAKPIVGEDAIKVIKEPVLQAEIQELLIKALERVEMTFKSNPTYASLTKKLISLKLPDNSSVKEAVYSFYQLPTDTSLRNLLRQELANVIIPSENALAESAVDYYLGLLRAEITASTPTAGFTQKMQTLYLQAMQADLAAIRLNTAQLIQSKLVQQPTLAENSNQESPYSHAGENYAHLPSRSAAPDPTDTMLPIVPTPSPAEYFTNLRAWLNRLADAEYRDLIRTLLTPDEQTSLPNPVMTINRGDFLGHMQQIRRLRQVEVYLAHKYADRRP